MVDQASRVLAGRYEVGELIGRGGMAEVHIGRDNRLSRRVAIKLLRSDLAQDSTFQARFRREAQSAAALNHPAIVSVYDTGEDTGIGPDGSPTHVPFIVMEYVEGHTVRELLRDDAALPIDEAVEITAGVLSALEYSHHAGIVHRDIKPANVMITTAGDVKVMDFGIARAIADSAATMTQTQAVVGTAQYLSPEQARGEVVDARSDVYSTGTLLFELLTGRPPFTGDSPVAVAYQHVREEPPTPSALAPDVPNELDRITLKALAKDRNVRYQSAEEFRADLEAAQRGGIVAAPAIGVIAAANAVTNASRNAETRIIDGPPTATTSSQPPVPPEPERKSAKGWIWALSIIAVLLIAGIGYALATREGNEEPTPEPSPSVTTEAPVVVPDVSGLTEEQARKELEEAGLVPSFENEASDTVEKDLVTRTNPAVSTSMTRGLPITVYLSTGPDALTVPNVVGMTSQQAQERLASEGFAGNTIVESPENDPAFPAGQVIRVEPGVGSLVPVDQSFTLVISTGNVDIPALNPGMTQEEAVAALKAQNLTARIQSEPSGDYEVGQLIRWDPLSGTVPRLSTVTLWIATEPIETAAPTTPPATETPSTTPPADPGAGDGAGNGNGNGNGSGNGNG